MDELEKLRKVLETTFGASLIKDFADLLYDTQTEIDNSKEKVLSEDYMSWIGKEIDKHSTLVSSEAFHGYNDDSLSNIDYLPVLFEIVEEYAKDNYEYPTNKAYGISYVIKDNDSFYEIGTVKGVPSTTYFVRESDIVDSAIDINDIRACKNTLRKENVEQKLSKLSNLISELMDENVSIDTIMECVDSSIMEKQIEKVKKLNKGN